MSEAPKERKMELYYDHYYGPVDIEAALQMILEDNRDYSDGTLEELRRDVQQLQKVLIKFITPSIKSVEDINALLGWDRFFERYEIDDDDAEHS